MPGTPALIEKKKRLAIVTNMIRGLGEVDYAKFLAMIQLNLGLSRSKAAEYTELLRELGTLVVEGGLVKAVVTEISKADIEKESKELELKYG
jgi:aldehyde:ferredoxin oxidoreductase